MNILNESMIQRPNRPIKVVQFGEGNFLRAFVDWMLQELNNAGLFNGDIAVVQPLEFGRVKELEKQEGVFSYIVDNFDLGKKSHWTELTESEMKDVGSAANIASVMAKMLNEKVA